MEKETNQANSTEETLKDDEQAIVALELEEENEDKDESSPTPVEVKKRGPLEEQRKGINQLLEAADRADAVLSTQEYRAALHASDYDDEDEKELRTARATAKTADQTYLTELRNGRRSVETRKRAIATAVDQIRKAKRRGRPLVSKRPELREEFCIGSNLDLSITTIRYQGPLVLAAVKDHFDDLPRYSQDALNALAASLQAVEAAVLQRNQAKIRIKQARRARDLAIEELRDELADLRLAADIAAETEPNILSDL